MKKLLTISLVGVWIAGCASPVKLQTKVFYLPKNVTGISVGRIITENPSHGQLFADYLRNELSKHFDVNDNSPYILSGSLGIEPYDIGLALSLKNKEEDILIVWLYKCKLIFRPLQECPGGKEFASIVANRTKEILKNKRKSL
jgi:hypothetical protein